MTVISVALDEIDLRPASLMRVTIDEEAAKDYASRIAELDPIVLYYDEQVRKHWLADGRHRYEGAGQAGQDRIAAEVRQGNYEDAWKFASRANERHGVRITNADKRARVENAIKEFEGKSARTIAGICGVSHTFILKIRPELETVSNSTVAGKDGKQYRAAKPRKPKPDPDRILEPPIPVITIEDLGGPEVTAPPDFEFVAEPAKDTHELSTLTVPAPHKPLPGQRALPIVLPEPEPEEDVATADTLELAPAPRPTKTESRPAVFDIFAYFDPIEEYLRDRFEACPEGHRRAFALHLNQITSQLTMESGLEMEEARNG